MKSDSEGLGTRRADDVSSSLKIGNLETQEEPVSVQVQRQGKTYFPSVSTQSGVHLPQTFCSIQVFNYWMRSAHIRESNLLYSAYEFKC